MAMASVAPEASPSRMPRSSSGVLPSRSSSRAMAGLGRAMRDEAMVERARVGGEQHRGGGRRRHSRRARTGTRARRAAITAPAIAASSRPPRRRSMSNGSAACGRCRADRASTTAILCVERRAGDAGARPDPIGGVAAEQARRHSAAATVGVADPHLAQRQDVDARLDRHHAVGHGEGAVVFAHRRRVGEIRGRLVERHLIDAQIGVDRPGRAGSPPRRRR